MAATPTSSHISCRVGADYNATTYTPLIKQLALDLHCKGSVTVSGYSDYMSFVSPSFWGMRGGYFIHSSNGAWHSYTATDP